MKIANKKWFTFECMSAIQEPHNDNVCARDSEVDHHEYLHAQSQERARTKVVKEQKTAQQKTFTFLRF